MIIEEVSVLFDTGRKGDAAAATRKFHNDKQEKEREILGHDDDVGKGPTLSKVERI